MKKFSIFLLAVLFSSLAFCQRKEKIKGSKVVTIQQVSIDSFSSLEVEDNIEVFLVKGSEQGLEIEADENLHEIIGREVHGNILKLYTHKNVTGYKKLSVRVTYNDNLQQVTAKHESIINALATLELSNITIKNIDYSKSYLNVKSDNFALSLDDKAKVEINLKSSNTIIDLSKNAELKALIASESIKLDMYQKSKAVIEGDVGVLKLRLDNNALFAGSKLNVKEADVIAESYSKCGVMATDVIALTITGKSEVQLFGTPKIDMKSFADSAILYKKEK